MGVCAEARGGVLAADCYFPTLADRTRTAARCYLPTHQGVGSRTCGADRASTSCAPLAHGAPPSARAHFFAAAPAADFDYLA
jgi:hypothetical protein